LGKPCFYVVGLGDDAFANLQLQVGHTHPRAVVRVIRGRKSRTVRAFFDEVSAALQFPYYFGENWAAFDECITDLDWLPGDAYLFLISRADLLLCDAGPEEFQILVTSLASANVEWVTPNAYMPRQRPPTPFHVLVQSPSAAAGSAAELHALRLIVERLSAAG